MKGKFPTLPTIAAGVLLIFVAMLLWGFDSPATPLTLVAGMVSLGLGCFPWARKLPSYMAAAIGGTLLAAACLAGVYVPLFIPFPPAGPDDAAGFTIHLINFMLGVPGAVLIVAGISARIMKKDTT